MRVREEGTFSRGEEEEKNKRKKKQKKNIRRVRESYGVVGGELRGPLVWGVTQSFFCLHFFSVLFSIS